MFLEWWMICIIFIWWVISTIHISYKSKVEGITMGINHMYDILDIKDYNDINFIIDVIRKKNTGN